MYKSSYNLVKELFESDITQFHNVLFEISDNSIFDKLSFLESSIVTSNYSEFISKEQKNVIINKIYSLKFPKNISYQENFSCIYGNCSLLCGTYLLFGENFVEIPAVKTIFQSLLLGINRYHSAIFEKKENKAVSVSDYDLLFGITSFFNLYLELFSKTIFRDNFLEKKLMEILDYYLTFEFNEFKYLKISNKHEMNGIYLGCAHGLFGIYSVLKKYLAITSQINTHSLIIKNINNIELFLQKNSLSTYRYIYPSILASNLIDKNDFFLKKNLSWCHGLAGYLDLLVDSSEKKWSIYYGRKNEIIKEARKFISEAIIENPITSSATFCHGLTGLIYACYKSKDLQFSDTIDSLLIKLHSLKQNDDIVFYDHSVNEYASKYDIVSGSIGTWLTLSSLYYNKPFNGDFIFGK